MNLGSFKRGMNVFTMLLYAKVFKKRIPVRVALQITRVCNMRCSYCYANFETYRHVRDRTTGEIFKLIDELYGLGMRWLWILGGEPLLRKDLGEIIDYAKRKGIFTDITTNGVLISEKNIDVVKKLDAVCISFDGDEESNDYYRGKGTYKKLIEVIKFLKKHNIKARLHSMLTKRTLGSLDNMIELSEELGIVFNYCEILKNKEHPDSLTDEEYERFYKKYMGYARKKGKGTVNTLQAMELMLNWPKKEDYYIYKDEAKKYATGSYIPCISGGGLQCFLDVDGRVYACPGLWDDGLNAYEVGFKKAWDYLENRKCAACRCLGMTEASLVLGLHPSSVLNGLKNILRLKK